MITENLVSNSAVLDPTGIVFWTRIGATVLCGGIVGLERQLRGKPAGIRTSILICLGTHIFVSLAASLNEYTLDPSRVLGQVVTGIGFIGAGVIMSKEGLVKGVTSAAIIWVLAGIGAAIGLGNLPMALSITLVAVGVLWGVEFLESTFKKLRRGVHHKYHKGEGFTED
ncbi:MAG: MgtC/SapB family protein [Proteobacteria bacterium]|nr:MgtC/SapB family protein [Pseudomonadota bacterium]MBU1739586.1 MgtC/SapB family protein [Pseudomonadota bacterium]